MQNVLEYIFLKKCRKFLHVDLLDRIKRICYKSSLDQVKATSSSYDSVKNWVVTLLKSLYEMKLNRWSPVETQTKEVLYLKWQSFQHLKPFLFVHSIFDISHIYFIIFYSACQCTVCIWMQMFMSNKTPSKVIELVITLFHLKSLIKKKLNLWSQVAMKTQEVLLPLLVFEINKKYMYIYFSYKVYT